MMQSANPPDRRQRQRPRSERGDFQDAVPTAVPEGIFILDHLGVVRFANHTAERLFGYSSGQLAGFSFGSLISGPPHECVPTSSGGLSAAPLLEAAEARWEALGRCKTGTEIRIRGCCTEIPGGDGSVVITVRETVPVLETGPDPELLSKALEQSPYPMLIVTTQGKLVYANAVFLQLAGGTLDPVYGAAAPDSAWQATERQLADHLARLLPGRGTPLPGDWPSNTSGTDDNGTETISPIRNETGEITHFLIIDRDVARQGRYPAGTR